MKKIIESPIIMLASLTLYAISMAIATFIEKYHGTATSQAEIYHAWWFITLQLIMAVNAIAIIKKRGLFALKNIGSLTLHISFIIMLIGALTTHLFSKEGYIQLREGQSTDHFVDPKSNERIELGFIVTLDDFVVTRYAGSSSPSSFQSNITVTKEQDNNIERKTEVVAMNKIVNVDGYRLFQTSYDKDERGTLLTVNYDVPGMQITYLGYLLLLLGIIMVPFQPQSRFRTLLKRLNKSKSLYIAFTIIALSATNATLSAQSSIGKEPAERFGSLLIQNNKGRIEPVNTWSAKILRKIHNAESYKGLTSDQVMLNLLLMPHEWAEEPIIRIKNKELRQIIGSGEYTTYNSIFSGNGEYKIAAELEKIYSTAPNERTQLQKDILNLDEVVNIFFQVQSGAMMPIFPHPHNSEAQWLNPADELNGISGQDSLFLTKIIPWYADEVHQAMRTGDYSGAERIVAMINTYQRAKSDNSIDLSHINAELKYNRLNIFGRIFKLYLIFGAVMLLLQLISMFKEQRSENHWIKYLSNATLLGIVMLFALHSYGIGLRWYIAGHGPWSNSYETMVFVAWSAMLIGLIFGRKMPVVSALCSMLTGVLLFVSTLNWINPEISPLVPVLQSYWLMLHVAVIMLSYGFLFISMLLGLTNMITLSLLNKNNKERLMPSVERTTTINELSMIIGVSLLAMGIFLGAVWANVSWGRYWGWDPKESWALITMVIYTAILHMRFVKRLDNIWVFNVKSTWAILSVLMTYFGVNYYLSGMHSYGNTTGNVFELPIVVAVAILAIITAMSYFSYNRVKQQ